MVILVVVVVMCRGAGEEAGNTKASVSSSSLIDQEGIAFAHGLHLHHAGTLWGHARLYVKVAMHLV